MDEVVLRKQKRDYDGVSECSEDSDSRILGAPQLICLLTCGTLLLLVGVFVTSYGYLGEEGQPPKHVMKAVGPAFLALGLMVLLICVCACLCACQRNHHPPPLPNLFQEDESVNAGKPRATFYYDQENIARYVEQCSNSRPSVVSLGFHNGDVQADPYPYPPNSTLDVGGSYRQSTCEPVAHRQAGRDTNGMNGYFQDPQVHRKNESEMNVMRDGNLDYINRMAERNDFGRQSNAHTENSYRKISGQHNFDSKHGHSDAVMKSNKSSEKLSVSDEENQRSEGLRFMASTVALEQRKRQYTQQTSLSSTASSQVHDQTSNHRLNYSNFNHDRLSKNYQEILDITGDFSARINHIHSSPTLENPDVRNHMSNTLPDAHHFPRGGHHVAYPGGYSDDERNIRALKRANKMPALNVGFVGDTETSDSGYAPSAGYSSERERTYSISATYQNRVGDQDYLGRQPLRRNYSVSTTTAVQQRQPNHPKIISNHRNNSNRQQPAPPLTQNSTPVTENPTNDRGVLYRQQLSLPTGSFQHLDVRNYEGNLHLTTLERHNKKQQHDAAAAHGDQTQDTDPECEVPNSQRHPTDLLHRALGSIRIKAKSKMSRKKTPEDEGPVVCPLPSCSTQALKAIGVELPDDQETTPHLHHHQHDYQHNHKHQQQQRADHEREHYQQNQSPNPHHHQYEDSKEHHRYLHHQHQTYTENDASDGINIEFEDNEGMPYRLKTTSGGQDCAGQEEAVYESEITEVLNRPMVKDQGIALVRKHSNQMEQSGSLNRLSRIPEVSGNVNIRMATPGIQSVSGGGEESTKSEIAKRMEEIKEKIEEISREKEKIASKAIRRPSMGVPAATMKKT